MKTRWVVTYNLHNEKANKVEHRRKDELCCGGGGGGGGGGQSTYSLHEKKRQQRPREEVVNTRFASNQEQRTCTTQRTHATLKRTPCASMTDR